MIDRQSVALELSQLQRHGIISCKAEHVSRTMRGEFDFILRESLSVREAADAICGVA